ncbi:GGDEF domain-containing protein [Acinetobacter sp. 194]|uniref:GGDEF domain-containing protein n=1 Tax=Acinetobacter shaoyimingii TaxID=2715164 RepID=UPI00140DB21E|nr:GGDEF domain-containing protein [Acinetobacter shaoyimingii]NHB56832.1 GGDEF domain-containing protein [Acinetobacter shaoyimingii]
MLRVHSERISRRLFFLMLIIVLSLCCISIPLIISSYNNYGKAELASVEIDNLAIIADLANKISRERGPSNLAMSSTPEELDKNLNELYEYRKTVDQHIALSFTAIENAGLKNFDSLKIELEKKLSIGRKNVDDYIQTPFEQRTSTQLTKTIYSMFDAWDATYNVLKKMVMLSENKDSAVSDYYTLILILSDLRDQAGRVASNVMADVTFAVPMSNESVARALQSQKQVIYLWDLVNTIQPETDKTSEFIERHKKVKTEFIDQGLPLVLRLIDESNQGQAYSLKGTELTQEISGKFATVIDFQKYLLDYSIEIAQKDKQKALRQLMLNATVTLISLLAAIFTMIYAQRKVFAPLIEARDMIVELSYAYSRAGSDVVEHEHLKVYSLYDALQKLQQMLKQRDAFEFELKSIANTDKLTGVSNRLALEEYIKFSDMIPNHFDDVGLIVIDIDNFKHVNDHHGHIFGDEVITAVASCLKRCVRSTDLVVRFGGDEFLIVLESIEMDRALTTAEKIRNAVNSVDLYDPDRNENLHVSVSIGVAVGAEDWKTLLDKADKSLLQAKANGKNTVSGAS